MLVTMLLVAVLVMDIKCTKRLQVTLKIHLVYMYEYLVQLHLLQSPNQSISNSCSKLHHCVLRQASIDWLMCHHRP